MKIIFPRLLIVTMLFAMAACGTSDQKDNSARQAEQSSDATSKPVKVPEAVGPRRILFVGNSHTEYYVSIPDLFKELCTFNKQDIKTERLVEMGISLKDIYTDHKGKLVAACNQQDKDGNYYDYVVLQEKTPVTITDPGEYRSSVKQYMSDIRKNSPGAVFLIYEVMSPADYDKEKADYEQLAAEIGKTTASIVTENDNAKLYRVSEAISGAYKGKNGYQHRNSENADRLRFGDNTLHLLNDGGFLAATLLYTTIFDKVPAVPAKMPLSTGTVEQDAPALQEIKTAISNPDALLKIASAYK